METKESANTKLTFHLTHSTNIQINDTHLIAKRLCGKAKALAFGSRSVNPDEKITVKITQNTASYDTKRFGAFRFGFTLNNPADFTPSSLPEYVSEAFQDYWWNLPSSAKEEEFPLDSEVTFWFTPLGQIKAVVTSGSDSKNYDFHMDGWENKSEKLWPVFFIGGATCEIEIQVTDGSAESDCVDSASFPCSSSFPSSGWHFVKHGSDLRIFNEGKKVRRIRGTRDNGFVMLSQPLDGVGFTLQVTQNVCGRPGLFRFGLTKYSPDEIDMSTIPSQTLPDLACRDGFLMQIIQIDLRDIMHPETLSKKVLITLNEEGTVCLREDQHSIKSLMFGVDINTTWWPFLDLAGAPTEICIVENVMTNEVQDNIRLLKALKNISGTSYEDISSQEGHISDAVWENLVWKTLAEMSVETLGIVATNLFIPEDFQGPSKWQALIKFLLTDDTKTIDADSKRLVLEKLRTSAKKLEDAAFQDQKNTILESCATDSETVNVVLNILGFSVDKMLNQPSGDKIVDPGAEEKLIRAIGVSLLQKISAAVVSEMVVEDISPDRSDELKILQSIPELETAGMTPMELKDILDMELHGTQPQIPVYEDMIKEAMKELNLGEYDSAEKLFASAVRVSQFSDEKAKREAVCFYNMSRIYLHKAIKVAAHVKIASNGRKDHLGLFIKAMGLVQSALCRDPQKEHHDLIEKIEEEYLRAVNVIIKPSYEALKSDINLEMRKRLDILRKNTIASLQNIEEKFGICMEAPSDMTTDIMEIEKERTIAVGNMYRIVSEDICSLLQCLINDCVNVLGTPPCNYAVLVLGSLARQEMTPYSDVELAIVISDCGPERINVGYFCHLSYLMHLRIIMLGESILPALAVPSLNDFLTPGGDWYIDTSVRGLSFDGLMPFACKIPTGSPAIPDISPGFELIGTPNDLLQYQWQSGFSEKMHLPDTLAKFKFVSGDSSLSDEYRCLLEKYYDDVSEDIKTSGIDLSNRQAIALSSLQSDFDKWQVVVTSRTDEGKVFHAKKELYRLPSLMIQNLAMYFHIQTSNSWEALNEMLTNCHISSHLAHHIAVTLAISMEWRMRTYSHHRAQQDSVSSLPKVSGKDISDVGTASMPVKTFIRLFYSLIPIQEVLSEFAKSSKPNLLADTLKNMQGYRADRSDTILIHHRLQNYSSIIDLVESHSDMPKDTNTFMAYIQALESKGRTEEARELLNQFLNSCDTSASDFKYKKYLTYQALGLVLLDMGDLNGALKYYQLSVDIVNDNLKECFNQGTVARMYYSLGSLQSRLGDYKNASSSYQKCLSAQESVSRNQPNTDMVTYLDGFASLLYVQGNVDESVNVALQALNMAKFLYGHDVAHPVLSSTLQHLGHLMQMIGQHEKAFSYHTQALQILQAYNDDFPHINLVLSQISVASFLFNCGWNDKAKVHFNIALDLHRRLSQEEKDTYHFAYLLCTISHQQIYMGDFNEAQQNIDKAIKIYERGPFMLHISKCMCRKAQLFIEQGLPNEALKCMAKAEEIIENLGLKEYPVYIDMLSTKMECLLQLREIQEAIKCGKLGLELLDKKQRVFTSLEFHQQLMECYMKLNQVKEASFHIIKALQIAKLLYVGNLQHVNIGVLFENLGNLFRACQRNKQAIVLLKIALQYKLHHYGSKDGISNVIAIYNSLANAYVEIKQEKHAYNYYKKALEVAQPFMSSLNVNTLGLMNNIAAFLYNVGNLGEAFKTAMQVMDSATIFDEKYILAGVLNNTGQAFMDWGEMDQAVQYLERAVDLVQQLLPEIDHPDKAGTLSNLGRALLTEDPERGILLLQQAEQMNHRCMMQALSLNIPSM